MTKKGRLSEIERQTIFLLTKEGYDPKQIATTINRTEGVVKKYLDTTNIVDNPKDTVENERNIIRMPKAKDFMINKTMGDKEGVSIMTKTASEKADESRLQVYNPSRLSRDAIHRIDDHGKKKG